MIRGHTGSVDPVATHVRGTGIARPPSKDVGRGNPIESSALLICQLVSLDREREQEGSVRTVVCNIQPRFEGHHTAVRRPGFCDSGSPSRWRAGPTE